MTNYERIFPTKSTYTAIELLIIEDIHASFNNLAKSMGYYPMIGIYHNPLFRYMKGAMVVMFNHFIPRMTDRQLTRIIHATNEKNVRGYRAYYEGYDKQEDNPGIKTRWIKPDYFKDHVDEFVKQLYEHLNEVCKRRYKDEPVDISSLTQVGMLLNELSSTNLLTLRDLVWHEIISRGSEDGYYKSKGKDPIASVDTWNNHKLFFYNVEHAADFFNLHPLNVAKCIKSGAKVEGMHLKRIDGSEIPEPYTGEALDKKEEYPNEEEVHLATNPHLGE